MRNPALRVWLSVKRRTLDVNIFIPSIKVDVLHRRRLTRQAILDAHLWEVWRQDKIDVLSAHWPHTHHGKSAESSHGAGVVVAGNAVYVGVEQRRDVVVAKVRRQAGTASIVEEKD